MGRKKWRLGKLNKDQASQIASKFGIDAFLALLLSSRGLETDEEIERFLCRNTEFVDPFLLPDMDLAVDRINDAIFDYEKICIFGLSPFRDSLYSQPQEQPKYRYQQLL